MKLTLTTADGVAWTRGCRAVYSEVWPEDERSELSYEMKRQDYLQNQPANLLALKRDPEKSQSWTEVVPRDWGGSICASVLE
jgi:hypothetical protein